MTARLIIDNTHRPIIVPEQWYAEHLQNGRWPVSGPARHVEIEGVGDAVPARALVLRNQSLRLFSLRASVTIAAICLVWFGGQLIRGWLS